MKKLFIIIVVLLISTVCSAENNTKLEKVINHYSITFKQVPKIKEILSGPAKTDLIKLIKNSELNKRWFTENRNNVAIIIMRHNKK